MPSRKLVESHRGARKIIWSSQVRNGKVKGLLRWLGTYFSTDMGRGC
ncbi:MAG: hypothetical protein Q4A71_06715 [Actinomycetaceae bacterium]|nr:hypothetical protein [Actinomycetaceae bacterium]